MERSGIVSILAVHKQRRARIRRKQQMTEGGEIKAGKKEEKGGMKRWQINKTSVFFCLADFTQNFLKGREAVSISQFKADQ